jgi:lipopolysaccharide export system permease protein
VKILSKYILREHVGPFVFALAALTSLMILNFISRQFGELVGKGLPASVIAEFFALSVPFTVALTLPMSVLVAVLYAFSRLAAENEVTALKASGVSPWRLVTPALMWGAVMSLFLLAFNDQVLPRANFRLKTLQDDIAQTKPTFLLKPNVINAVQEEKLYLRAGRIDQGSGRMREVVIYDLSDPTRRRTIYADSGTIHLAGNKRDLVMDLYVGQIQSVATEKPGQLDRLFYQRDQVIVRDVVRSFDKKQGDTTSRGDRELGVCAMQKRLIRAKATYDENRREYTEALRLARLPAEERTAAPVHHKPTIVYEEPKNLGWAYCTVLKRLVGVKAAEAAELRVDLLHPVGQDPRRPPVDSARARALRDSAARRDSIRRASLVPTPATPTPLPAAGPKPPQEPASTFKDPFLAKTPQDSAKALAERARMREAAIAENLSRTAEVRVRFEMSQRTKNRYEIEINKKFSLAAACLFFVILGAPLALRFPRGGVGLVLLVSLIVFALYYVGLIGGESLANKGIIPPFWAMWGTNVILTIVGLILLLRMGREENSGRGGNWQDRWDRVRERVGRRRPPVLVKEAP